MSNHSLQACGGDEGLRDLTIQELEVAHRHMADTLRAAAIILRAAAMSTGGFAVPGGRLQKTVLALAESCEESPVVLSAIVDELIRRQGYTRPHSKWCRGCRRPYLTCSVFCEMPNEHYEGYCNTCKGKVVQ